MSASDRPAKRQRTSAGWRGADGGAPAPATPSQGEALSGAPAASPAASAAGFLAGTTLWLDNQYLGKGKKSKETLQLNSWLRAVPQCGGAVVTDQQAAGRCTHAVHHSRAGSWGRLPDGLRAGVQHVKQSWLTDSLLKGRRMDEAAHRPPSPPPAGLAAGGEQQAEVEEERAAPRRRVLPLLQQPPMKRLPLGCRGLDGYDRRAGDVFDVMTRNLWQDAVCAEERIEALGQEVLDQDCPDIIMLQEVTPLFWSLIRRLPWFHLYGYSEIPREHDPTWTCGVVVLFRKDTVKDVLVHRTYVYKAQLPDSWLDPEQDLQPREIQAISCTLHGTPVWIGSTHIMRFTGARKQSEEIRHFLQGVPERNCVLGGDFNWITENAKDYGPRLGPFRDAWRVVHGRRPGYTWDPKICNQKGRSSGEGARLDRVVARLADWQPCIAEVIGQKPIPGLTRQIVSPGGRSVREVPVWVSDHLGVYFRFYKK